MSGLWHSASLRQLEQQHANAQPGLMERAGQAIADWITQHFPQQPVTVVAGPGNNGGDALIAARHLQRASWPVRVHRHGAMRHPELEQALSIETSAPEPGPGLLLDGLFGIGLDQAPRQDAAHWIAQINQSGRTIVAIDLPSGLISDTGHAPGAVVRARHTLTMLGDKPGLHTGIGRDVAGCVTVFDLGVTNTLLADYTLLDGHNVPRLTARPHASHKGSFGTVAVIGGTSSMVGAALLAGRAALHAGAGKVFAGLLNEMMAVDPLQPELMLHSATSIIRHDDIDTFAIGPGLGQSERAESLLRQLLERTHALVIDADGLNLLSRNPELAHILQLRDNRNTVLTPHPAEAARLLGMDTAAIQSNRIVAAEQLRDRFQCCVVLKGSGSIIAAPGQPTAINGSGNGALAAAGQGDVLSGVIAALQAQGMPAFEAASLAVWAHGHSADLWRKRYPAGVGLTASETLQHIRSVLNGSLAED